MITRYAAKVYRQSAPSFAEWPSIFHEGYYMMLTAYADESYTKEENNYKNIAVCGYIAKSDYWKTFESAWRDKLNDYGPKSFHFREFNSKEFCSDSQSPYFEWPEEKRDNYFYDLAMIAGGGAVPFGGVVPAKQFVQEGIKDDPVLVAYTAFFSDLRESISMHWPKLNGQNFKERVHFVLDCNTDKKWVAPFTQAYNVYRQRELIFGGITWGNDESDLPLQSADLLAAAARQQNESGAKTPRVLDLILNKNLYHKREGITFSKLVCTAMKCDWITAIKRLRKMEKDFRQNNPGKKYFPFEHPPLKKSQ